MGAQPSIPGSWRLDDLLAPAHQRLLGDLEPLLRARLDAGRTTIAGGDAITGDGLLAGLSFASLRRGGVAGR